MRSGCVLPKAITYSCAGWAPDLNALRHGGAAKPRTCDPWLQFVARWRSKELATRGDEDSPHEAGADEQQPMAGITTARWRGIGPATRQLYLGGGAAYVPATRQDYVEHRAGGRCCLGPYVDEARVI